MVNYQQGKIYKIVSNVNGKCYVGATTKERLCDRLSEHVIEYRQYLKGNKKYKVTSFNILETGDYSIVLLEEYPCTSKDQLNAKEREWIEKLDCVNKFIPTRTQKEWEEAYKEIRKEKGKVYREQNKDKITLKNKKYVEKNKDKIALRKKNFHEQHKEEVNQKRRENYANKSSKWMLERQLIVKCECGTEVKKACVNSHKKSKKHLEYIKK